MIDSGSTSAGRAYVEAMRAEVNWAPLRFDGWSHYEQARPTLPDETIEVIARWPDRGYTLQYRPLLGELTEARQYPIDPFPTVTVLGRIDEQGLASLRSSATTGDDRTLSQYAREVAVADRTIPTEPPVRTGSIIPAYAEVPVHYEPLAGLRVDSGQLIDEDHPSTAYAVAGHLNLRLGEPVGVTPTGLLVFQPVGLESLRVTIEQPLCEPVGPYLGVLRVGVYRNMGLGAWFQTATVGDVAELRRVGSPLATEVSVPATRFPIEPTQPRWVPPRPDYS